MDAISDSRLSLVHPLLRSRIISLVTQLEIEDIPIRVMQGVRTWDQQNALYAKGRNGVPGPIVTDAPAGSSWHNFGLACDIVPMDIAPGQPDWDTSHPAWQRIIALAPIYKLFSGSQFRTFPDWPHVQPVEIPESPTDTDRQDFTDGGTISVWKQYFPDFSYS